MSRTCDTSFYTARQRRYTKRNATKVRRALMFVHSFSEGHSWFDDFRVFADAIGTPVSGTSELSAEVEVEGVSLRLGWVADEISP